MEWGMKAKTVQETIQANINTAIKVVDEAKGAKKSITIDTEVLLDTVKATLTEIGTVIFSNFSPEDIPANRDLLWDTLETLVKSQHRGFLCGEDGVLYTPSIEGLKKALGEE
jgi:hypothetical protein